MVYIADGMKSIATSREMNENFHQNMHVAKLKIVCHAVVFVA